MNGEDIVAPIQEYKQLFEIKRTGRYIMLRTQ